MFVDARTLPSDTRVEADVCIIGCGPAGTTLALELMSTGARIVVLEAGAEEGSQAPGLEGASSGEGAYPSLQGTRAQGFAGTSNVWSRGRRWLPDGGLRSRPLDPIDFEARSWLPDSGWPFGYEHLLSYYKRANAVLGLGPYAYGAEAADPESVLAPLPLAGSGLQTTLFRFARRDVFVSYRDVIGAAPNVEVLLNARAVEVEAAQDSAKVGRVREHTGHGEFSISARLFVLAGGGVENARLLLLSRNRYPQGLGNGNDLVGRYFMEHLSALTGRLHLRPLLRRRLDLYRRRDVEGVPVLGALKLSSDVRRREQVLGVVLSPQVGHGVLFSQGFASYTTLLFHSRKLSLNQRLLREHLPKVARNPWAAAWGSYLLLRGKEGSGDYFGLSAHFEQAPQRENRVRLSDERDELGLQRAEVQWRLGEDAVRSVRRTLELAGVELSASGLGTIEARFEQGMAQIGVNHHHMGTTRMHADPTHGVVDANSRVHGIVNLYVAGSSVFPTGGAAAATLTLVALTIRLADHLKQELVSERIRGGQRLTGEAD